MSDAFLSFTIIFAQLGGVLLLALFIWVICFILRTRKEGKNSRELIEQIKQMIPEHRDQLKNYFKNELDSDEKKTELNIETLMSDERKIYDHLINVSISKDMSLLKLTTSDLNKLINDYVRLLSLTIEQESDGTQGSRDLRSKKENEALRLENVSLQKRLDSATETIESMMGEFSSMYEGGKKEGEQRVKNEMYKLQQSLQSESARAKAETDELEKKQADEETSEKNEKPDI